MKTDTLQIDSTAGQMLMLGFDGLALNDRLKYVIGTLGAGGLILFSRNIQSRDQVALLCGECQAFAASCGLPPLFIAIDQEGGTVARLSLPPFTRFRGNPYITCVEEARQFAEVTARELRDIHVNMNFAPVMDVAFGQPDSIMKDRAFPGSAENVARLGAEVIRVLQKNRIMAVAKHFPGIGRTVKDSHFFLPELDTDLKTLEASDLVPFAAAKQADVAGIMMSHILYTRLDPKWPASLSPAVANDLLRDRMGYDGLVMTDDLDMKAVKQDMAVCMRRMLASGVDMSLICHQGPNIDDAFQALQKLVADEPALELAARRSVERILRYKRLYLDS